MQGNQNGSSHELRVTTDIPDSQHKPVQKTPVFISFLKIKYNHFAKIREFFFFKSKLKI